jgi:nucleoside-diphosphate-sugar epimerase
MQFISVGDLVELALRVMEPRNLAGHAFNTANPRPVTQHELVLTLARAADVESPKIVSIPRELIYRAGGQAIGERLYFGYYYDLPAITEIVTKAQRMLAFKPTDFLAGLRVEYRAYLKKRNYPKPDYTFEDHLLRYWGAHAAESRPA